MGASDSEKQRYDEDEATGNLIQQQDAEIDRLQTHWEETRRLVDAYSAVIDEAVRLFKRITSADGSGHADIGRSIEAMKAKAQQP